MLSMSALGTKADIHVDAERRPLLGAKADISGSAL